MPAGRAVECERWTAAKARLREMLELGMLDLEQIATALSDQDDYDHFWLLNPQTGELVFWTSDTGIDGTNPVELDELEDLGLVAIEPLPSSDWYRDMADFVEGISNESAARRLGRAINGRGAFRRFKDELYTDHPELIAPWHAFRDARAVQRAVEWLTDQQIVDAEAGEQYLCEHPDPKLP